MIPKMRLSSGSVGLPLARVPGWTGGSGGVCWLKATNPQKQLAPRRAATRITSWMLACHRELQGIATNGTLGAPSWHSRNELLVRAICVGERGLHDTRFFVTAALPYEGTHIVVFYDRVQQKVQPARALILLSTGKC